jgi:hypothetical protein
LRLEKTMKYPIMLTLLGAYALGSSVTSAEPLAAHRWQHRLVIGFANSEDDARVDALNKSFAAAACELEDRDLIVGWSFKSSGSRLGDHALSAQDAEVLRRMLRGQSIEFLVMLIGKDGGVKARYADVPPLVEIFALIDGMPMRRSEMRSPPSPCDQQAARESSPARRN